MEFHSWHFNIRFFVLKTKGFRHAETKVKKLSSDQWPQRECLREFLMVDHTTRRLNIQLTASEMFLKKQKRTMLDLMFPRDTEALEGQRRQIETTTKKRDETSKSAIRSEFATTFKKIPLREEIIVGQRGQMT
ncbi:hypothetical protein TTRE_0000927901 [Trichuris trichiura]|uniref:Uncharacterized protein n=1 Tax=Trichuris trichiura TaxID=36087 RepID=A0A077ZQ40_TRITR|nr:hypothetical protein TTRE_0000927901 [Trichuris trichiura]